MQNQIEYGLTLEELEKRTQGDHSQRIFLRADRSVSYGDLMEAMNLLRRAGYLKVALVGVEQSP